jgi:hypothetical protein
MRARYAIDRAFIHAFVRDRGEDDICHGVSTMGSA